MKTHLGFTTGRLSKLECPTEKDRVYFHDTRTKGLCLCVSRAGGKTFFLYRWVAGKPSRVRLGTFPNELTVATARDLANGMNIQIAAGGDPQSAKMKRTGEATFGYLFEEYMEHHAKPRKRSWKEDQRQFDAYLTHWRNKRLSEIDRMAVQSLHNRMRRNNGPTQANRTLALVRGVLNKAIGLIGWEGSNPAARVEKFKETSRERFLQGDELPRWFAALEDESENMRDFFTLALLTGARRRNVEAMRWEDVHIARGVWIIPGASAKAGKPLDVVLVPEAVAILERRLKANAGGEWVFPTRKSGKSGHLVEPIPAWKRICKRADIEGLRIHDLRRTLGSWQAATGASLPIIGKSLGHTTPSATTIYARLQLDSVREAVNKATTAIIAAGKVVQNG